MRNILPALAMAVLTASSAQAEPFSIQKRDTLPASDRLPAKRAGASNPCSAFGPGFVKVDGTETCVKLGGAVSVGAGGSSGSH
jgi:hypothetical protein